MEINFSKFLAHKKISKSIYVFFSHPQCGDGERGVTHSFPDIEDWSLLPLYSNFAPGGGGGGQIKYQPKWSAKTI